jgi:ribonuclease BN (tRNA processing enzyme)
MDITFLGTGNFATDRKCTSFVIDNQILFDIGYGITNALRENNLDTKDIRYLIISHFHGDHIGDIVHFLTRRLSKKESELPLTIIAPIGAKEIVRKYLTAHFANDIKDIEKFIPYYDKCVDNIVEIKNGGQYKNDKFEIEAFKTLHSPESLGYIIKANNCKIGCSGDTEMCESLLQNIKNADNWVINCSHEKGDNKRNMSATEIIKIASGYKNKKFFGVHRNDYVIENLPTNLFLPNDNDTVSI